MRAPTYLLVGITLIVALKIVLFQNQAPASVYGASRAPGNTESKGIDPRSNELTVRPIITVSQPSTSGERQKLTPEKAKEAIERARRDISNLSLRRITTSNALHNLCLAGYLDEAWGLVDPNYGTAREKEISRILDVDQIPLEHRIKLLSELTAERDIRAGCNGLMDFLTIRQLLDFDWPKFNISDEKIEKQVWDSLSAEYVQDMRFLLETKPEKYQNLVAEMVESGVELARVGRFGINQLIEMLAEDPAATSFPRWEKIQVVTAEGQENEEIKEFRRNVIEGMILADPEKAMLTLLDYSSSHPDSSAISDCVASWYRLDSGGANSWVAENNGKIPAEQKDQVIATVARIALGDGDAETARKWASRISDESLRIKLEIETLTQQ